MYQEEVGVHTSALGQHMHTSQLFTTNISASLWVRSTRLHNDFLTSSRWLYHFLSDGPSVSSLISAPSPLHHQLTEEAHAHLSVTFTLEHHFSAQKTKSLTAGGDGFILSLPHTHTHTHTHSTDLWLFGVFPCSRVPDGAHVQNLHLLKQNKKRQQNVRISVENQGR